MSIEKISDFVSCQLFMFTSVIKLRNFDSKSQLNTFFFVNKNNGVRFKYAVSNIV